MNSKKEVEYIAEIARLKSELKKSIAINNNGVLATSHDLIKFAERCINQASEQESGRLCIKIIEHERIGYCCFFSLHAELKNRIC